MKKLIVVLLSVLAFAAVASAQPRALGIRAGYGGELSYQHGGGAGFLEADLGFLGNAHGFYVTGIYDFIFANAGVANFYVGPGVQLGFYNYDGTNGFNAGLAGQLGVEFEIPSVPLNISLDWRPVYYFNYGGFGWQGIALGIRYRF
ncbi:MAG: hypothetical protein K5910_02005 [Bacteroidales bacterium]|nr:hypothetical protein [Bacteroidales bacterium]